jgi:hypothetical protein
MKKQAALVVAAITLLSSTQTHARDPFGDAGRPLPVPSPDPVPFVVPAGLYYVTDTYVADVVATNGPTTTYSTTTVHESTGTYARVIDTVDTGASSRFDGAAFNGRGALTDGRALAGTYYENFVLTSSGYVPVSIVFFQDDSETRRRGAAATPSPRTSVAPTTSAPATAAPSLPAGSVGLSRSVATPTPSSGPATPIPPVRPTLRAGIALAPDGPALASAEILRGRLIQFWPRVFADGDAVPIRSWRLLSAQPDHTSASTGVTEPLTALWLQMPVPGRRWDLQFEVFSELAPTERLEAQISITVRSPALID